MKKAEQHPADTGHHTPKQAIQSIPRPTVDPDTQLGRVLAALAKAQCQIGGDL